MRTSSEPGSEPASTPPAKKAPASTAKAPSAAPAATDALQQALVEQAGAEQPELLPEARLIYAGDPATAQAHIDALIADGGFPQSVSAAPDGGFWILAVRIP